MIRIFGALILTAAASTIGIFKAAELKKSVQILSEMISFLEILRNEICTRRTPVKQILKSASMPQFKFIQSFVIGLENKLCMLGNKSFSAIWSECAENYITDISQSCMNSISILGSSIGRYDAELQSEAIERCVYELSSEYKKLNSNLKSNEKMYIGLGTGVGLIISIILI